MSKKKMTVLACGALLLIVAIPYVYLAFYKDYAPRMQDARRTVFKQTQSYVDGKITHLNRLKLDYQTAGEAHKSVLRSAILTEASTIDMDKLPPELRRFIDSL